jgi:hypothetical protein
MEYFFILRVIDFRLFEEILLWSVNDFRVLFEALPVELQQLPYTTVELKARIDDDTLRESGRATRNGQQLGFVGFVLILVTASNQV